MIKELNSSPHVDYVSIINQLRYYIKDHFDTEEEYMREYGYGKIESHIKEHNDFENKFKEIMETSFIDDAFITTLLSLLNEWFLKHILEVDKELAVFLLKHEHNDA
ncbi:MAG: hemerythrin family protein [Candidatus Scalindua sp.]|jgi:hemerythrin|nr:hemerythrin family protein [Candidatus Scalindua sp.]MBT6229807.1 hemerythrin family protein [Candidatus Scalindua sp.]MBT7590499.1 hemerythrin family protein [Candidatus Scalindua sp.]